MDGGLSPTAEEVAEELQELARSADRAAATQLDLPRLWGLVGDKANRLDVVLSRISLAVESMPDPERSAARHLFVRPGPWRRDLGARQTKAAVILHKKPASFRARRPGVMSAYDRLSVALAHRLLADATMRPPGSEAPPTLVAVSSSALRLDGCHIPVGALMTPVPEFFDVVLGLQKIYEAEGGRDALGCPAHTARKWDVLWLQDCMGGTRPPGVIILRPDGDGVWMPLPSFTAYFRSGGRDGSEAQRVAGLPLEVRDLPGGALGVDLSLGGVIVSEVGDGRGVWAPAQALETWERNGGATGALGLPMADVNWRHGRLHQDFAGGYIFLADDGTVEAQLIDPSDAQAELEAVLAPEGPTVLKLYDGSVWIGSEGQRRWVPDQFAEGLVDRAVEVPASVLCRLPLGAHISGVDDLDRLVGEASGTRVH